jgi:hypothetical protein
MHSCGCIDSSKPIHENKNKNKNTNKNVMKKKIVEGKEEEAKYE